MVKRSKGFRNRTRSVLRQNVRERGNPPITHSLRTFEPGTKVAIVINPAVHAAMPHPRYKGLTGTVQAQRGKAFEVKVRDGGKERLLICGPEHLKVQT